MFEYFWLPCMVTVAAVALSAILFIEFLKKKRAGQIAVEGRADSDSARNKGTTESADPTSTSPPLNETATSSGYDYEVFLSFRGPDTRSGFTDFLYTSLVDAGIRAFKDDEDLRVGEEFASELLQAIKQSKISIPIFSKGYASSVWCLKELAQMVECKKTGGQKIMPIFYDVAPSEVRRQIGGYGEAFRSHVNKKRYDEETMREWKAALEEVSFLNGWDLQSMPNRKEGEFARKFTQKVFSELKKAYLAVSACFVSVDNHANAIMKMVGAGTSETKIIGIHGMGGIGKTTIAKVIYNKLSHDFENFCFLPDIRERSKGKGIQCLQNQLVSDILKVQFMNIKDTDQGTQTIKDRLFNKRVLILLDDVEEGNHIDALVGKRDWLGKGSKIIITTRNKDILEVPEVDCSYELSCMNPDQSLQLFSKHAFRKDYPLDGYIDQSKRVIAIAGGLPLTLEVIGSLLCRTKKEKWDLTLGKLENVPHATVQSKLRISYDALDIRQQHIFLDVACLLIGYDKDIVVHFWDESKYPEDAMEVLQNMCLIKIAEDNKVWMHDQLGDLGRDIVRQESAMKIKKQSRVWDPNEGLDLLRKYKGNKEVEVLRLKLDHQRQYRFTYEDFENLSNLRFLELDCPKEDFRAEERLLWHESTSNVLSTNDNSNLLPQLRWLSWCDIPPTFNIANFSMEDVVILNISRSEITHDWKGWSHMKAIKNLKVMNLRCCSYLERTPIFSAHANLERLILNGCSELVEIDGSICRLKCLTCLDVRFCQNLRRLPNELGNLESLIELDIAFTRIGELPDSMGNLKNLKMLEMAFIPISKIPDALWTIEKLEEIDVVNRGFDGGHLNIDNCIYRNQSLKILRLMSFQIYAVPKLPESLIRLELHTLHMKMFPDLSNLTNLTKLDLVFGRPDDDVKSNGLVEYPIPRWIGNLTKLESLRLDCLYVTTSPTDISLPPQLKSLNLKCPNLRHLPRLSSSLSSLNLYECYSLCSMESLRLSSPYVTTSPTELTLPSHLKELYLCCPKLRRLPRFPSSLSSLYLYNCQSLCSMESLDLSSPYVTTSPADLTLLPHLKELHIYDCPNLRRLPRLPSSLFSLFLYECKSLCSMEDLANLNNLSSLLIRDSAIEEIPGLGCLENLRDLKLSCLGQVKILPDLSNLNGLRSVRVESCGNLVEIQGALPRFLDKLYISSCDSLQNLPDLSSSMGEKEVEIVCCSKLNVEAILGCAGINTPDTQLSTLEQLQMQILPDLNNPRRLEICGYHDLIEIRGELPESLEVLHISLCHSLQNLPNLSSLMGKQEVIIRCCINLNVEAILGFAQVNPRDLQLSGFGQLQTLPDLSNSSELRGLEVYDCCNLVEILGELPQSLEKLKISSCESLRKLPDLSSLKELQEVVIEGCTKLKGEAILGSARRSQANWWENLRYLRICGIEQLEILPDLSNLNKLRCLHVQSCDNLVEIQGELPKSLEVLEISSCINIQKLSDLSSLNGLRTVKIYRCFGLNVEAISLLCSEKSVKFVGQPHLWEKTDEWDREDAESESEYDGGGGISARRS
ncbi:disease resistance protein L6-like [Rhodamnia argentea]|uniref:Disease resistance protein L6-like n=1 Tax=Rhodamnia argentea TaxID=178133 RepID=A0ABM3GY83_9MYRT|nr:disease resistance protein L6-like [Rhodamnia argentea]